jgi:hypothetical protein
VVPLSPHPSTSRLLRRSAQTADEQSHEAVSAYPGSESLVPIGAPSGPCGRLLRSERPSPWRPDNRFLGRMPRGNLAWSPGSDPVLHGTDSAPARLMSWNSVCLHSQAQLQGLSGGSWEPTHRCQHFMCSSWTPRIATHSAPSAVSGGKERGSLRLPPSRTPWGACHATARGRFARRAPQPIPVRT